jgi:SAM-dependent methyltransferase
MTAEESIKQNKTFHEKWYYSIELLPGMFTDGQDFSNIILTRKALRHTEVENMNCLDIGTMEGMMTILLKRRGAANVIAYDRLNFIDRVRLVKKYLNIDFEYIYGMKLVDFSAVVKKNALYPFDIVLFSGVLYHMFDPLGGLSIARGMVRDGGILILETSAIVDKNMVMFFNADGRFYPGTNYWQISLECLDYILRFLKLKAIDLFYHKSFRDKKTGLQLCRICIPCRAVNEFLPCADDEWMNKPHGRDYEEFIKWDELKTDKPDINWTHVNENLILCKDTGAAKLYETVQTIKETPALWKKVLVKTLMSVNDINLKRLNLKEIY